MTTADKEDAEFKRFVALGAKIAKRLKKKGVDMKLAITFGPAVFEPKPRRVRR